MSQCDIAVKIIHPLKFKSFILRTYIAPYHNLLRSASSPATTEEN